MTAVASELFLMAVDDRTGRLQLNDNTLSRGLAGALLAELVLDGSAGVRDGFVIAAGHHVVPVDPLLHQVLAVIRRERPSGIPVWLEHLSLDSVFRVRQRLIDSGVLNRPDARRRWLGRNGPFRPIDPDRVAFSAARPGLLLAQQPHRATDADIVLCGLVLATELDRQVLGWEPSVRRTALDLLDRLRMPLRQLIDQTQASIGAATIAGR